MYNGRMELCFLKSKLHRARVTHARPDYEGSCAIDKELLDLAQIGEYERIEIYNVSNGERLTTYAIAAEHGSRVLSLNGAAARKAVPGDRVIVCAYAMLQRGEASAHVPVSVVLDEHNNPVRTSRTSPAGPASSLLSSSVASDRRQPA